MRKSRFSDEQMVRILREADKSPIDDVAKKHGVSAQTLNVWKRKFGTTSCSTPAPTASSSSAMSPRKTSEPPQQPRSPVVVAPGAGRTYAMGPLNAVFKADGNETRGRYSISEWWLDPYTRGPGAHQHEEDDVFFVLEGTMSFFVGGKWLDAPAGSLVIAPGGTPHDFENRTGARAGALNVSVPGDFEPQMEGIADWFRARSATDARTANAPTKPQAKSASVHAKKTNKTKEA